MVVVLVALSCSTHFYFLLSFRCWVYDSPWLYVPLDWFPFKAANSHLFVHCAISRPPSDVDAAVNTQDFLPTPAALCVDNGGWFVPQQFLPLRGTAKPTQDWRCLKRFDLQNASVWVNAARWMRDGEMVCICIVICYFKLHFCKYFSDHTGRQDASVLSERNSATVCAPSG